MGVYYFVVCDGLQQKILPGGIRDDCGSKEAEIGHPDHPFGQLIMYALTDNWRDKTIRLSSDHTSECEDYLDITAKVVDKYNRFYGTNLKYKDDL